MCSGGWGPWRRGDRLLRRGCRGGGGGAPGPPGETPYQREGHPPRRRVHHPLEAGGPRHCPAAVRQVSGRCPASVPGPDQHSSGVSRKCPARCPASVPQPYQHSSGMSRRCPASVPQVSRDRNRVFPECPARCPASIPRVSRGRINVVPRRPPRRCDTPCSASCRYRCPCIGAARRVYRRCVRCYNNEKYSPSNYIEIITKLYLSFNKHLLCKPLNQASYALRSSSTLSAEHCYIGRLTMSARNRLWIIRLVMSTCNHLWMRPTQLPHTRQCQDPPKMPRLTASSNP